MKYIFVAGAPGSKWSSVVKNIYYSPNINRTDYSDERTYYHDASGKMQLMHLGAYFDPGMEFDLPVTLSTLTKKQAEVLFDKAFEENSQGIRIVKSHIFSYYENLQYLRKLWPECRIILVHRSDDACLGWWVKCGHFNITYPKYEKYYVDLKNMAKIIEQQNKGIMLGWNNKISNLCYDGVNVLYGGTIVFSNLELCGALNIKPPKGYYQDYIENDVKVKVI